MGAAVVRWGEMRPRRAEQRCGRSRAPAGKGAEPSLLDCFWLESIQRILRTRGRAGLRRRREERRKRAVSAHRGARDGECSPAIDGHCRVAGAGYEVMRWWPPNRSLSACVSPCGSCPLLFLSSLRWWLLVGHQICLGRLFYFYIFQKKFTKIYFLFQILQFYTPTAWGL